MLFACTQENLVQSLGLVSHITSKNINLPVLGNVLLRTENGNLKLCTTNLEQAVSCLVRGKVEREGEYTVPAKLFLDYVSLLPSGKVELELKDEGLEVRTNDKETLIKGLPASEFPLLPKLTKSEGYGLDAAGIKQALSQVVFAASPSESRPELTGIACFIGAENGKQQAVFVATDSYRLAERSMRHSGAAKTLQAIVPSRSMLEVARVIGAYKDEMRGTNETMWSFTDNQLVVTYGNVELVTRLIEGSFPPYQEIIPSNFRTEMVLSRQELQKAVRAASLFSRQGLFDIHLSFDPDTQSVSVASADQGTGKTKAIVKGQLSGESNRVTLNFRYVNDGLAAVTSDSVRLSLIDEGSPVLLRPEPLSDYRYLIMPIRQ